MVALDREADFVARFLSTKHHNWRGKYKRIFCIGLHSCATINPGNWDVSNQWTFAEEFVNIMPSKLTGEFIISLKKGKKAESMKFSCDYRPELLTEGQRFRSKFCPSDPKPLEFSARRYRWDEVAVSCILIPTAWCLQQLDPNTKRVVAEYEYKDISYISPLVDDKGFVVAYGSSGRMHGFSCSKRNDILKACIERSLQYIGFKLNIRKDPISMEDFRLQRLGKWSDDISIMSLSEFNVYKIRPERHEHPVSRVLGLSERCLVEHDPESYHIVTSRAFVDIYAIVRDPVDVQKFSVEYNSGAVRTYTSPDRDALLASLLDGVRAAGNRRVSVNMVPTNRGMRVGPLGMPVDEETEALYLKTLAGFDGANNAGITFAQAVERFNANVDYSGLRFSETAEGFFTQNKEKLINNAISSLLNAGGQHSELSSTHSALQFQAIRRLVASRAGFAAFTEMAAFKQQLGKRVVHTLKHFDEGAIHAAIDVLGSLMVTMFENNDPLQEQANKESLLASKPFVQKLVDLLVQYSDSNSAALVVNSLLEWITFAICSPYSDTTSAEHFDDVLLIVANMGRSLFKLFKHKSMAIIKGAGMIMRAIIEEGEPEIAKTMQYCALTEGSLLQHLHISMFTTGTDWRHYQLRELSRHLVGLWLAENKAAVSLMSQCVPVGLLSFLDGDEAPPEEILPNRVSDKNGDAIKAGPSKLYSVWSHWRSRVEQQIEKKTKGPSRPVVMRRRRQLVKSTSNWPMFFYQVLHDHARADLIWNHHTREEMRESFEAEVRAFNLEKSIAAKDVDVSWNYPEFEIVYVSLKDELKIGDIYLRLLLEEGGDDIVIREPKSFFSDLYHRYLLSTSVNMRSICLRALALVYRKWRVELGHFNDTAYIVTMLDRSTDKTERDLLLLFLQSLLLDSRNAKWFVDANGVRVLVDLATLAHLHTERAPIPMQSNVLEAGDMVRGGIAEWYYTEGKDKIGPITFKDLVTLWQEEKLKPSTKCWAQGLDAWKALSDIGQLRWQIMATGSALLDESELAKVCLSMLISVCEFYPNRDELGSIIRPAPRIMRLLASPLNLPHLVQLLLTFDPPIVERTATLLNHVMSDNPNMSSLYLTGAFYFALMYTGSNLLPIARLLETTHAHQAFNNDESIVNNVSKKSILSPLLPEAMVCFLQNYGSDRFSETFLGEYDNPEAIWNREMRRLMIEKIALHLSEFSPRLYSNVRAHYQYHPIPSIQYPELSNELFCGIYYLRHLCDKIRFPDWPITNEVELLQETLLAWKAEVEKKPPSMNVDEAYDILQLPKGDEALDEHKIRRAYFKLAAKYHPDKNPDGREMFEKISKAYEFLSTRAYDGVTNGPNPSNLVLLLSTQSILFRRYSESLAPYKYAGYPMLIQTIQVESADVELFSKNTHVLAAATELAYCTIYTSPLNAEELRRDNGIVILSEAYARCLEVIGRESQPGDMAVNTCTHISLCYEGFGRFAESRDIIKDMPMLLQNICRCMYMENVPLLVTAAIKAVASLGVESALQATLLNEGALWHLVPLLFEYDYTLDEGGVESTTETNKQSVLNAMAKFSVKALANLAGYRNVDGVAVPAGPESTSEGAMLTQSCLFALLTPYLTRRLADDSPEDLLKILTSNTETPYLIWNNATRAQLLELCHTQADSKIRSGTHSPDCSDFMFDMHRDELKVGGVFLRIYNEQPQYQLEDADDLAISLLSHLSNRKAEFDRLLMDESNTEVLCPKHPLIVDMESSLKSFCYVILNNAGTELHCMDHLKFLFSFLLLESFGNIIYLALEAITAITTNKECVLRIAELRIIGYLCIGMEALPAGHEIAIKALHAIGTNSNIVNEMLTKGTILYLLDMFCSSLEQNVREGAASVFSKLAADKLHGPKVVLLLAKFLPKAYLEAMRDSVETAVHMFEGAHENPELIWNEEARDKVKHVVKRMRSEWSDQLRENIAATWKLPTGFENIYAELDGEIFVGGVYIRLFNKQPTWSLRNPREFMVSLLDKYVELVNKNADEDLLGELTTALVGLLKAQQDLQAQVPSLGHIPKIFDAMAAGRAPKSCIEMIHQIVDSNGCIEVMSKIESIKMIKDLMAKRGQQGYIMGVAAETLKKAYSRQLSVEKCNLVSQAMNVKLPHYMLELLGGGLDSVADRTVASGMKAHVVKALKYMEKDPVRGGQVTAILEGSSIWAAFRDQRHDLFITNQSAVGMLTAGPQIAGMLTAGPGPVMPDKPPPMIEAHEAKPELLRKGI